MLSKMNNISQLIAENRDFFESKGVKFENLTTTLKNLSESVENCVPKVEKLSLIALEYDFDETMLANGFHSFVDIFTSAIKNIQEICEKLEKSRSSRLFFSADRFNKYECKIPDS
jgi:phage-related protein